MNTTNYAYASEHPNMTPREIYAYAYRLWRASKGSAAIRDSLASRMAWRTYMDQFMYTTDYDPIIVRPIHFKRCQESMSYKRLKIRLMFHLNSNFLLSDTCKWGKS